MVTVAVFMVGLALLVWPGRPASLRLAALTGAGRRRKPMPNPGTVVVSVVIAALGWAVLDVGGALAGGLAGVTGCRQWQARRRRRQRVAATVQLTEALRSLVGELRAGAHPATAADNVASDASETCAAALRSIASAARFGGNVVEAVRGHPDERVLTEVAYAWALAQRHGLPLAVVLDSVVRDLDQRTRFAHQVQARMAGPRASAAVLALLPAFGLVLGELMGARPLHVLGSTRPGQLLLVVGVALICAGVLWSARLTRQVVLS